jgi:hypothetical protein
MLIVNQHGEAKKGTPRTIANYWATARQNLALIQRSEWTRKHYSQLREEYSDILEQQILIYPQTLAALSRNFYSHDTDLEFDDFSYKDKKRIVGLSEKEFVYNQREQDFNKFLKEKAAKARKATWQWRITQEMEEKQALGWHPFFITLTLDPNKVEKHYESTEEFWRQGKEWRLYLRSIAEMSAALEGHPPPRKKTKEFDYRPESDYVTYVGVIEHGKSREHHHMHVLMWIKNIPDRWKQDPNRYIRKPENRTVKECKELRGFWKWSRSGLSPANYFRSKGDIWQSYHFGFPIDEKTGKVANVGGSAQSAAYLTKYIQKDHKQWKHRVKATRNLGMKKLKQTISQLSVEETQALTWRPENSNQLHSLSLIHSVPLALIRRESKQKNFQLQLEHGLLDFQSLMISNGNSYQKMLRSVRHGHRPDRMPSQDFYNWVCRHLPDQKGFCEKKMIKAHKKLKYEFPRIAVYVQPISQGGNIQHEFT